MWLETRVAGRPNGASPGVLLCMTGLLLIGATASLAHGGGIPALSADTWPMWSLQPSVILPLGLAAALYARGVQLAWTRAGRDRGIRTWQAVCFAAGIAALLASLVSPLDALGESLFAAHMAQHVLLMGVAAPLLVLGRPLMAIIRALPRSWQRRLGALVQNTAWRRSLKHLTASSLATVLMLGVFLIWHAPSALGLALESEPVHVAMHGSILAAALPFWTMIARSRTGAIGRRIVALFICFKFSLILGALLTFSGRALYPIYGTRPGAWGMSLIEDQQLGGVFMMTVAAMMYPLAALIIVAKWFAAMEPTGAHSACGTGVTATRTEL